MSKLFRAILIFILPILLLVPYFDSAVLHAQSPGQGVTASVEAARDAGVPDGVLSRILTLSVNHQLSSTDVVILLDIIRTAGLKNLPLEPFVAKIEEGLAKKVAAPAIGAALERKVDDYRFVQDLMTATVPRGLDPPVSDEHLNTMVDSLSGGISREEFTYFIQQAPPAQSSMVAIAVENLALLNQVGFERNLMHEMLYTGLRLKRFSQSWRYLARVIVVARKRGIPDQDIAEATIRAMEEKLDLRDLMATLGFTGRDLRHGPAVGR